MPRGRHSDQVCLWSSQRQNLLHRETSGTAVKNRGQDSCWPFDIDNDTLTLEVTTEQEHILNR